MEMTKHKHNDKPSILIIPFLLVLPLSSSICVDMYLPAYSNIAQSFHVPEGLINYSMSIYLLGLAIGQLCYGYISDKIGRKKVLISALLLFVLSSIACAFSSHLNYFLLARLLQAIGASSSVVLCRAIISDLYASPKNTKLYGWVLACNIFSPLFAPMIGGFAVSYFTWRLVFLIIAGYGCIMLLSAKYLLFETAKGTNNYYNQNFSMQTFFYKLKRIKTNRSFLNLLLSIVLLYSIAFVWIDFSPTILLHHFKVSQNHFGRYFLIPAIADTIGALFIVKYYAQINSKRVLKIGLSLIATAILLLMLNIKIHLLYLPSLIILPITLIYFGFGFLFPKLLSMAIENFRDIAGFATGLIGFSQVISGSIVGVICRIIYQYSLLGMTLLMFTLFIISLFFLLGYNSFTARQFDSL